jgi:hypothetical protein
VNPECIRLHGVRQNNLKGFDLDVPLGRFIVVSGLSGAGKSSLVFDTLHAEGQRRYVETFSAYTRQFLDLLDKPKVDAIENIRPSIAIGQTNTVKTSRSTVGTMTELTDFCKVWFSHVAECFDPATGEKIEDDNPQSIWRKPRSPSRPPSCASGSDARPACPGPKFSPTSRTRATRACSPRAMTVQARSPRLTNCWRRLRPWPSHPTAMFS